ncbi:MAG: hypothetical protein Q4G25_02370 [Paracoccus sp. (in: a-proteobacteria)]|nr:hypothetical protein [Paracoccus sp. (in: a-proteobacteria)]
MANESSNNSLYFIVGALVIAVAVVFWLMTGNSTPVATSGDSGGDTTVTIETTDPAPAADAPAVEVEAEAPAADAPAPAN